MTLPRTAWIDDDGTGTLGTILNNAEKTLLYNQIDQLTYTVVPSGLTGAVHNWQPGLFGHTLVRWVGTADLTITGIAGGLLGQRFTILNYGSGVIRLPFLSASSLSSNKFVNFVSSGPTPVASRGVASYVYTDIGGENGWTMVAHDQGAWLTAPYSGAHYGATGGTWTVDAGDVSVFRYRLHGRTLSTNLDLVSTSVSSTSVTALIISNAAYGDFSWTAATFHAVASLYDAGTYVSGAIATTTPATGITLNKLGYTGFASAAQSTHIRAAITGEVV